MNEAEKLRRFPELKQALVRFLSLADIRATILDKAETGAQASRASRLEDIHLHGLRDALKRDLAHTPQSYRTLNLKDLKRLVALDDLKIERYLAGRRGELPPEGPPEEGEASG